MNWELSKENIQPLPQGRKMSNLQAALKSQKELLAAKRHEFEVELRTYDGDDPLDVWFRYISWVQQNYPSGGKESGILELCKKALYNFNSEAKYKNDERFLQMWLIYANINSDQSLELYSLMHQHGIGSKVALFYKTWAWEVECLGNSRKADGILSEGIAVKAEPLDELIAYHQKFQERMVKKVHEDADENFMSVQLGTEAQRKALGELKTHGKSSKAPVSRVGSSVLQTSTKPVSGVTLKPQSSNSKKTQIFVDDEENQNQGFPQVPNTGSKIAVLPGTSEAIKENAKMPGPWNKGKLKTKAKPPAPTFGSTITLTRAQSSAPSIPIYCEEEDDQKKPAKTQPTFTNVLSDIKDFKPATFIIEPFDPTKKPMYDKWRVYGGPEEMSFEELRALKIANKLNKKKEDELMAQLKLMKEKLQEKDQLLQNLAVKSTSSTVSNENSSQSSQDIEKMCTDMRGVAFHDNTEEKPTEKSTSLNDFGSNRKAPLVPNNDEETMEHDGDNYKFSLTDDKAALADKVDFHPGFENKLGPLNKFQVPKSAFSLSQKTDLESGPCSAPATEMSMIRELWNGSIVDNVGQSWTDNQEDFTDFKLISSNVMPATSDVGSKIKIYTDEDDLKADPNSAYEHDDKENCPPRDTQPPPDIQRNITGILQPSVDYPMAEPEEDDIYSDEDAEEPTHHNELLVDNGTPSHLGMSHVVSNSGIVLNEVHPSAMALSSTRLDPSDRLAAVEAKPINDLSVIMEASHEYNSKTSISSNSSSGQMNSLGSSRIQSHATNITVSKDPSFCTIHEDESFRSNMTIDETHMEMKDNIDPFNQQHIEKLLGKIQPPLITRPGYHRINEELCLNLKNACITIAGRRLNIKKMIAEGAYAKVYLAQDESEDSNNKLCALKIQKPSCYWEFYICSEIANRLNGCLNERNVLSSLGFVNHGYFYDNGSVLNMDYCSFGTLLDLANFYQGKSSLTPIEISIFLLIQILFILEKLHSCNVIHADFKPDNILIASMPSPEDITPDMFGSNRKLNLKLIDFGRSIDMRLLPEKTTFKTVVTTEGFTIPEMMESRPWTYQIDLYGFLVTAHVLLFYNYMDINNKSGKWAISKKFKRYWLGASIFEEMFDSLLNISDCENIPDIKMYRLKLEELLCSKKNMNKLCKSLDSLKKLAM